MSQIIDHEGTAHAGEDGAESPYAAACGYPPRMRDGSPWAQTERTRPSWHWGTQGEPITCLWCLAETDAATPPLLHEPVYGWIEEDDEANETVVCAVCHEPVDAPHHT